MHGTCPAQAGQIVLDQRGAQISVRVGANRGDKRGTGNVKNSDNFVGVDLHDATVRAEGDLDFRGTLAVDRDAPVGFKAIRLRFDLDTDASEEQRATLIRLTERFCVVYQTLRQPPAFEVRHDVR